MFSVSVRSKLVSCFNLRQQFVTHFSTNEFRKFSKTKKKPSDAEHFMRDLEKLSKSRDWRNVLDLVKNEGMPCNRLSVQVFNNLTAQAFRSSDNTLGWEMLHKISEKDFQPNCETFQAYLDYCTTDHATFAENMTKMLEFIGKNELIVSKTVIEDLSHRITEFGGSTVPTEMSHVGICQRCEYQMPQLLQSELEFQTLKREFEKVIVKPKFPAVQLSVFRQMVNKKKSYDYIIDSLNVTRVFPDSKGNISKQGKILINIVEQLRKSNKKVFVVGKKHIETWPESTVNFIRKNATVFLSNNKESLDDIFLMYAALISGPKAHFVTNDLLTDYMEEFSEQGKDRFKNWQKQHQHFVLYDENTDTPQIYRPKKFHSNARQVGETDQWHIPFTKKPLLYSLKGMVRVPIEWVCVKLKANSQSKL